MISSQAMQGWNVLKSTTSPARKSDAWTYGFRPLPPPVEHVTPKHALELVVGKPQHLRNRILGVETQKLVSMDFKGDERSSIIDADSTMSLGGNFVKVLAWYDNEWGYSCRVADLVKYMGDRL